MDASDPEDDRRHDDAFKAAWNWLADNGLSKAPPAQKDFVAASSDKMRILDTINLLRASLQAQRSRTVVDFKDLTGVGDVSALETVNVIAMLIEGTLSTH
jgi:hypothetical protein